MERALTLVRSTIGKKVIVAVTGVVLFGYLIGHLLGNLLIFAGPEAINSYSATLHASPALLWGVRVLLLVSVTTHIVLTIQLAALSSAARPVEYKKKNELSATLASRTMIWTGPVLALYIVYHVLHLTLGYTPATYTHSATDVYSNLVNGFRTPIISTVYIVAMLGLALHLYHGAWSIFQSLGLNHPRYNRLRRTFATALTVFVCGGNIFIPVAVMTGLVH